MSISRQVRVGPLNPVLRVGRSNVLILLNAALARFDETTIVGSSPVTESTNRGTGGGTYSLNVIVGTGANLTTTTVNSLSVITSSGSVGMEVSAV